MAAAGGLNGNVFVYPERIRLVPKSTLPWYRFQRLRGMRIALTEVQEIEFREPTRLTPGRLRLDVCCGHAAPSRRLTILLREGLFRKGRIRFHREDAAASTSVSILFHKGQRDTFFTVKQAIDDCLEALAKTSSTEMVA